MAIRIHTLKEEAEERGVCVETVRRKLLSGELAGFQASGRGTQRFIVKSVDKDAESGDQVVVSQ